MVSLRRLIVPAIVLLLISSLAACAAQPRAGAGRAEAGAPAVTESATSALEPTEPAAASESAPSPDEPSERTIEHAVESTTIVGTPQRIVALEWTYVEDLLALGVQPAGVADVAGYNKWVNAEPALSASVVDVGTRQEPSLDAIAALEPDLIIGVQFRHEPIYDNLSAIAPTLLFNPYPEDGGPNQLEEMEQTFLTIADAVNRREQGEKVLAALRARLTEAAERLDSAGLEGSPFVLAQAFSSGDAAQIRLFTDNSMASQLLMGIGLENAWEGEFDPYGFNTVGVEALLPVEQANFFYVVQDDDNVFAGKLAENPVWKGLAFVEEGRAYPLGGDTWLFGGPLSAQLLVEKVVAALTGEGASEGARTIEHAAGKTEIGGIPERIVALEYRYVEDLLALGIQPVGVADVAGYNTLVDVEPALASEVVDVGTRQEPNLEAIAALEPDLIIGARFRHEAIYDELSSIAPTLLFSYTDLPQEGPHQLDYMEEEFLAIADAVDRRAEAETILREMHATFDEAAQLLEAAGVAGSEFVLAQFPSNAPQVRLFTDYSIASQIMMELGLENAWEGEFDRYGFNTVGVEALLPVEQANFFYLSVSGPNPNDNPHFRELTESPVWKGLAFVEEGRAHSLGDTWMFGGPLSAQVFSQKIVAALTGS